ncbi:LAFA_0F13630g1_1 [Lachancea sp. 'fantastica']|nr:LAFA_0F13630g1_1 [Lachancea sp. 'fantastica']
MTDQDSNKISKPRKIQSNGNRALKACDTCRRMKTRCIPSPLPNEHQCLRCDTLKLRCSFQDLWEAEGDEEVKAGGLNKESKDSGKSSNTTSSTSYESAELTKRLLKSGYTPEHFAIHSKLLQNVNSNVTKILKLLETGSANSSDTSDRKLQDVNSTFDTVAAASHQVVGNEPSSLSSSTMGLTSFRAGSPELGESTSRIEHRHSTPHLASPFAMFTQLAATENVPLPITKLYHCALVPDETSTDVIDMNILSLDEVTLLMESFRHGYGKWCSFPESLDSSELVRMLRTRNASLLLTTTCVLALRYTIQHHDLKTRIYKILLYKLKDDLETSLRAVPQTVEFLQAITLLSLYANSFSSDIMTFDAWYLSGIGLQQFLTLTVDDEDYKDEAGLNQVSDSELHGSLDEDNYTDSDSSLTFRRLQLFRLWNHLCLAHTANCVFSGRMCIIDGLRADLCRRTLDFSKSTNFDGRMVAEIALQLILYKFVQQCALSPLDDASGAVAFKTVNEELRKWNEEWAYLVAQPIYPSKQYAEFALDYAHTIVLYTWFHRLYKASQARKATIGNRSSSASNTKGSRIPSQNPAITALDQENSILHVVSSMPVEMQLKVLDHARKAVEAMVSENFENFRFLSDQLIFQCVHSSLMCLVVARKLFDSGSPVLKEENLEQVLSDVKKFSLRLHKIREGELKSFWVEEVDLRIPSVILQYHKSLESCLRDKFPEYEIHVDDDYL